MLSKIKLGKRPNCLRVNSTASVLAGLKFISHHLSPGNQYLEIMVDNSFNVMNIRSRELSSPNSLVKLSSDSEISLEIIKGVKYKAIYRGCCVIRGIFKDPSFIIRNWQNYSKLAKLVVYFTVITRADNQRRMTNSLVWYFKEGSYSVSADKNQVLFSQSFENRYKAYPYPELAK